MKWFSGDIASAVTAARTRNAIFVVYCEGESEIQSFVDIFHRKHFFLQVMTRFQNK